MPTAVYSWRAMSAKRSTRSSSPMAASPMVSGHCENGPAIIAASGLSLNECRGSVEKVTGMPRRVLAATSCTRLCHSAISAAVLAAPNTLKCVMWRSRIISVLSAMPNAGSGPATVPPSPIVIIVWKKRPAFSSSVICPSRFSTRSSMGRPGSR